MDVLKNLTETLHFSKWYLAALLVLLLIQLPSAVTAANRALLNFPDLRHNIYWDDVQNSTQKSAEVVLSNSGFGAAKNVFIQIECQNTSLEAYTIDAQELYDIKIYDPAQGKLGIWLDRLSSGSYVSIEVRGQEIIPANTRVSIVSDQGTSVRQIFQSRLEQVTQAENTSANTFDRAFQIIKNSWKSQSLVTTVTKFRPLAAIAEIMKSEDFRILLSTTLLASVLIGVFLGSAWFAVSLATGLWIALWATYDATVSANWIYVPLSAPLFISLILGAYDKYDNIKSATHIILLIIVFLLIFLILLSVMISIHWVTLFFALIFIAIVIFASLD